MGKKIFAIGNALLDAVALTDAELPGSLGYKAFSTSHLEPDQMASLRAWLGETEIHAGGGAANTARMATALGVPSAFVGMVGDDESGLLYERDLRAAGVETLVLRSKAPTGFFCAMIHPDGKRTILVAPGAAPEVGTRRMKIQGRAGDILYLDGFVLFGSTLFEEEAERARNAGMSVAIDLGSRQLVKANRDRLLESILPRCDFVFANEDEGRELAGGDADDGRRRFAELGCAVIVKKAERGAILLRRGERAESPVRAQKPLDDTGAGDAFAAGFLAGCLRGYSGERCLRLGNRVAEEVISVLGVSLDPKRVRLVEASAGKGEDSGKSRSFGV